MTERQDSQVSYMWEEYTLTFGSAQEYRDPSKTNIPDLKKAIAVLKSEIREALAVSMSMQSRTIRNCWNAIPS